MPGIKDVALRAGVSPASVTRVLNGYPNVSETLRERVMTAVDELDYSPDQIAAGLRRGTSRTIGVVVSDIVNPLFAEIVEGLEERFRTAGYWVVLTHSHGDPSRDVESIALLQQRRVDGLVLSMADETGSPLREALDRIDVPIVFLDREVDGFHGASAVLSDHRPSARAITSQLIEQGHRRIALVGGSAGSLPGREREAGYLEAVKAAGLDVDTGLIQAGSMSVEHGEAATAALLDNGEPPTAILVGGNLQLVGVLRTLRERGVRVGEDIAVAACDDVPIAALHDPPITVIARDTRQLGREAAGLLLRRLSDPDGEPEALHLPTAIINRESTAHGPGGATHSVR